MAPHASAAQGRDEAVEGWEVCLDESIMRVRAGGADGRYAAFQKTLKNVEFRSASWAMRRFLPAGCTAGGRERQWRNALRHTHPLVDTVSKEKNSYGLAYLSLAVWSSAIQPSRYRVTRRRSSSIPAS